MKKKYIKKLSQSVAYGSLGVILVAGLSGCSSNSQDENAIQEATQTQNAFVIIEQLEDGSYKIAEEFPAKKTTIALRTPDGKERILSKEEIDKLVKEEAVKIDNGTSPLTNSQISSGGMGLGGVLLSSIAGAAIGSWIGNKLFNNQNFQAQKRTNYSSPQAYSRSADSFNKAQAKSSSSKKSGFFKSKSSSFGA